MPRRGETERRWWDDLADQWADEAGGEDAVDDETHFRQTSARLLLEYLVALRLSSVLNSKQLCTICY